MLTLILSSVCCIGGILIVRWLHNQGRLDIVVRPVDPPVAGPAISVCIPARNEERNIRACLEGVLSQNYPNFEAIVLDDGSSDHTREILDELSAQNGKLRILAGLPLPAGWAGKPHALQQAANSAHGEWLCFIDADTFLSPSALSACYEKAVEVGADLFTIMTDQLTGTF